MQEENMDELWNECEEDREENTPLGPKTRPYDSDLQTTGQHDSQITSRKRIDFDDKELLGEPAKKPKFNDDEVFKRIIQKTSGGQALYGFRYTKNGPSEAAPEQLINIRDSAFISDLGVHAAFSENITFLNEELSTKFCSNLKDFGLGISLKGGGHFGLRAGMTQSKKRTDESCNQLLNAITMQCIGIPMKMFKIGLDDLKLTSSAEKKATRIEEEIKAESENKNEAKDLGNKFLDKFGSHFPGGKQTLGGIFMKVNEAASHLNSLSKVKLKELHMRGMITGNPFGVSNVKAFADIERNCISEKSANHFSQEHQENDRVMCIGPLKNDPDDFKAALQTTNDNWRLIDRGEEEAFIPVWEIVEENGYKKAAEILKQIWTEKETENEKSLARIDLCKLKREYLVKGVEERYGPTEAVFQEKTKVINDKDMAYKKAIEMLMKDWRHNICGIKEMKRKRNPLKHKYHVTCWKIKEGETTYNSDDKMILFYSNEYFVGRSFLAVE